jgi:hypothetical protein
VASPSRICDNDGRRTPTTASAVIIDLNQPGVSITTTGPNGDRAGETNLETTRQFVKRCPAQIGINGGFFSRDL